MNKRFLGLIILLSFMRVEAASPDPELQHMPAYEVKSSPLGFIGIRVKIDTGLFGSSSEHARIKEMLIDGVVEGSPAERAGIHPKDRLIRIDHRSVTELTLGSLQQLLASKDVGDLISLEIAAPKSRVTKMVELSLGKNKSK